MVETDHSSALLRFSKSFCTFLLTFWITVDIRFSKNPLLEIIFWKFFFWIFFFFEGFPLRFPHKLFYCWSITKKDRVCQNHLMPTTCIWKKFLQKFTKHRFPETPKNSEKQALVVQCWTEQKRISFEKAPFSLGGPLKQKFFKKMPQKNVWVFRNLPPKIILGQNPCLVKKKTK